MKKRTIPYFVVSLLILSSFAALGVGDDASGEQQVLELQFLEPVVTEKIVGRDTYVTIDVEGTNAVYCHDGEPMVPMYTTTIELPFGTEILNIDVQTSEVTTSVLSEKVIPASNSITPYEQDTEEQYIMDEEIYGSAEIFPADWFKYNSGTGRNKDWEHVTFLTLRVFPVRYSPETNTLYNVESIDLTINYIVPEDDPFPATSAYDMVVIAPNKFQSKLQKLITHKNSYGISTTFKSTEDIYDEYTGVDKPEQIKYFIKDALETWDIKYVLIVGGMKSYLFGAPRDDPNQGTSAWHVPVRYTNLFDGGGVQDPGFISDLYYADIYKNENEFDDWDSNDDGIFANWRTFDKDILDLYPDVAIGRLACRNTIEVSVVVNKIVNYESNGVGDWFDTMILVGGDSHDDPGTNYIEGEVACDLISERFMDEFTPVKIYASYKTSNPDYTPTPENLVREISKGSGHLLFEGHGSPRSWNTHWPGIFEWSDSPGGIRLKNFPSLRNGAEIPVCVIGGCHNSQFNMSVLQSLKDDADNTLHTWTYGYPTPECFSWWLTRKIGGGTIATLGNTALGYGRVGENGDLDGDGENLPDTVEKLGGYQIWLFYKNIDAGDDILGDAWFNAETDYQNTYDPMSDKIDCKTLQQWPILGDPSLKIGGYPVVGLNCQIEGMGAGVIAAPGEEIVFNAIVKDGVGEITYEWDFDYDGEFDDATGQTVTWTWNIVGLYEIALKVTDSTGETDIFETIVSIEFSASTPERPIGPTKIKPGETHTYTTSISSTNWDTIYYKFDWGDGTESDWSEDPSATHTFSTRGSYKIRAKAMLMNEDPINGETVQETEWSDPLVIITPRTAPLLTMLQNLLERFPDAFPILRFVLGL